MIGEQEQLYFLREINDYLKKTYSYKTDPARLCDGFNNNQTSYRIDATRKYFRTYLRFGYVGNCSKEKSIVLANIRFYPPQSKYGSKFLLLLTRLAIEKEYKYIEIECVNSNSRAFAERFSFSPDINKKNYIVSTNDLLPILESYCPLT